MALTSIDKPDGFRPVGAGELLYTFTESTISGKPNYRVEITLVGLSTPVMQYRPDADLAIECNIAPMLRDVLRMSPTTTQRLQNTYVSYQAVWDGGSDSAVPLTSNIIYFYTGTNNLLNARTQFEITAVSGSFLTRDNTIRAWTGRTSYIDFLNGITAGFAVVVLGTTYYGSGEKRLVSIPVTGFTEDTTATIKPFAWTTAAPSENNQWRSVVYGDKFVAVSSNGTNRVMTSTDGITWTARAASEANSWNSVAYNGTNLYVAVAPDGTNRVMSSPDGITWTNRTAAGAKSWKSVTYGNGLFVAVADDIADTATVMTSPDGITWTTRTAAAGNAWQAVTYGNGLYVAVSTGGSDRVMTSPDGTTWTSRTASGVATWTAVTYGAGLYVAVGDGGIRLMTSPDGTTWTTRTPATANSWTGVTYSANGGFCAVANSGGLDETMFSADGITWTSKAEATVRTWSSVTYGSNKFVAVATNGTANGAMYTLPGTTITTLTIDFLPSCSNAIYLKWLNDYGGLSTRLFDYNQIFNMVPSEADDGRFKKMIVFLQSVTQAVWLDIMELNRPGAEFGDNQKLGAYVVDFTTEASPINIFVEPNPASTLTKARGNNAQLVLRYPLLENIGVSS